MCSPAGQVGPIPAAACILRSSFSGAPPLLRRFSFGKPNGTSGFCFLPFRMVLTRLFCRTSLKSVGMHRGRRGPTPWKESVRPGIPIVLCPYKGLDGRFGPPIPSMRNTPLPTTIASSQGLIFLRSLFFFFWPPKEIVTVHFTLCPSPPPRKMEQSLPFVLMGHYFARGELKDQESHGKTSYKASPNSTFQSHDWFGDRPADFGGKKR